MDLIQHVPKADRETLELAKYWLSSAQLTVLVAKSKLRWRVEMDDQELQDEFGLDHCEGCDWRGFHQHASLGSWVTGWTNRG